MEETTTTVEVVTTPDTLPVEPDAVLNLLNTILESLGPEGTVATVGVAFAVAIAKAVAAFVTTPKRGSLPWYLYQVVVGLPSLNWVRDKQKAE